MNESILRNMTDAELREYADQNGDALAKMLAKRLADDEPLVALLHMVSGILTDLDCARDSLVELRESLKS